MQKQSMWIPMAASVGIGAAAYYSMTKGGQGVKGTLKQAATPFMAGMGMMNSGQSQMGSSQPSQMSSNGASPSINGQSQLNNTQSQMGGESMPSSQIKSH